jgi:hypothetical protein
MASVTNAGHSELESAVERLLAEREIRDVLARYCRGIDRVELDAVRACYHADATDEHGSFSGTVDEYLTWVGRLLRKYDGTTHHLAQSCFDWIDDATIAVETYGTSTHWSRDGEPSLNLVTGFRFLDRFERRNGNWRIASRVAIADWSRRTAAGDWWAIPRTHRRPTRAV